MDHGGSNIGRADRIAQSALRDSGDLALSSTPPPPHPPRARYIIERPSARNKISGRNEKFTETMLTDSAGNAFSGFAAMAAFIALMIGYQDIKDGLVPNVVAMPASSSTPESTIRKQTQDNEGSDDESLPSVDSSSD